MGYPFIKQCLQSGLHANVYESLVYYNSRTFQVEPVLPLRGGKSTPRNAFHPARRREVP